MGCSLRLTESKYGDYSSYEKYESSFNVKNREGLGFGEERIPRVEKQFYHVRLNDSTVMDLRWVSKRPIVGGLFKASLDSSVRIDYLSKLDPINDSLFGTYRFTDFTYKPPKTNVAEIDSTEHRIIQEIRKSPPIEKLTYPSKRKIQITENGKCYYSDYVPGGPDSGGGMHLKFYGNILIEGDTITAILYQDVLYKTPRRPLEIKLFKNINSDTLKYIIDGEVSNQYGYFKTKQD